MDTIRLPEDEAESFSQRGGVDVRLVETGRRQQRVVGPLLVPDPKGPFVNFQPRRGVDEVPEQMRRFCRLVALATWPPPEWSRWNAPRVNAEPA